MLRNDRIILRALERDDLARLWSFNNDLETELAGGGDPPWPQSMARLEADFDRQVGQGGRDGTNFAIETDETFIGICSLMNINPAGRNCEIGITIGDQAYRGRGYGRETVTLLVDYAFRHLNMHRVWLRVNANNERAIRSYKATGFVEEGRLRDHEWTNGAYVDQLYMGILRGDWELLG